jgi:2-hydroxychromene-2-carboxylate isomerase
MFSDLLNLLYSFYVGEKFFWGTDRLFFVERALGFDSHPLRVAAPPEHGTANLTFFFDFSSPWSFLAAERLKGIIASVSPVAVKLELVPILLGALFKELGTPNVSLENRYRSFHSCVSHA